METVSVATSSETGNLNDCKKSPKLSDKKKKKRWGKKKRKLRKLENVTKTYDSHISSQNGEAGGAFSLEEKNEEETEKSTTKDQVYLSGNHVFTLPAKSCQQDSISSEEPEATLHDTDANKNGSSRKKSRKRKRKKIEDNTSCKEKILDAEKTTNEDQVHLFNAPLSKGVKENVLGDGVCDARSKKPKGKKRKKKKKKMSSADQKSADGNDGQELISYSASQREKPATGEESGFQDLGKTKDKETDENTEVKEDVLGDGVCDARSQTPKGKKRKRKKKKKKMLSADQKSADMEVCDLSGSVECLLDHSNEIYLQNCDGNAGQEFGGQDMTSKTEKSTVREVSGVQKSGKHKEMTKDENTESNQDAFGAEGASDVGRKQHKRKRNKKTNCESAATMDSEAVQCLSSLSNRQAVDHLDANTDKEIASKDLASKIEDSATLGERVEDAVGVDIVSELEVKTKKIKKEKNSFDHKIDDDMEKKDDISLPRNDKEPELDREKLENEKPLSSSVLNDISLPRNDEEPELDREKLENETSLSCSVLNDISLPRNDEESEVDREKLENEMSLSSSVLIQNNVAKVSTSSETREVPRCSCEGQGNRKLVIFDLNGILADVVQGFTGEHVPDGKVAYRSVFRRPFLSSFLDFCFERFDVAIWTSRRIGLDYMISILMRNYERNLLFCFGQNKCTTTKFKTQEKNDKPLFLKDLRRVWEHFGTCINCGKQKYNEGNTLLVDDSPDKALCNPPHTGIFPLPYQYTDSQDSALGPEGELKKYLERLADAENVQKFVSENPFGQTAITETHELWEFYSKVVEAYK